MCDLKPFYLGIKLPRPKQRDFESGSTRKDHGPSMVFDHSIGTNWRQDNASRAL